MTAEDLYRIVHERGLTIKVNDNGQPVVSGNREVLTPALIEALKTHRNEILTMLGFGVKPPKPIESEKPPEAECLWPGNGYTGPHWFPECGWPVGAYFFRKIGSETWEPIPGRTWNDETKRGTIEQK
jgi:hypothetical protein